MSHPNPWFALLGLVAYAAVAAVAAVVLWFALVLLIVVLG